MGDSEDDFRESLEFGYPAASVVLCLVGTLANLASLVYFIKKEEKSIGDKLLMLLNSTDLLLCICATIITILASILNRQTFDSDLNLMLGTAMLFLLYIILIDGTAYATCLLSVTRAIGIAFPFYQIKGRLLVKVGIIVFVIIQLIGIATLIASISSGFTETALILMFFLMTRVATTSLIILVVVSATTVAVYKLTRKDMLGSAESVDRGNIKATWTVVILSTLFFVFNSILLGVIVTGYWYLNDMYEPDSRPNWKRFPFSLSFFGVFFAIPLNSTLNPIVYLTRRGDMRQFFKQRLPKLCHKGAETD